VATSPAAPERVEATAPAAIQRLFAFPYQWAARRITAGSTVLDVGGGELRLGSRLLGAVDVDADPGCRNHHTADAAALPFADRSFDYATCFETVEHTSRPIAVVSELVRVAAHGVLITSVNSAGPNFLPDGSGIWKGLDNPHHLCEMDAPAFARLLSGLPAAFYGLMLQEHPAPGEYALVAGLHERALVNYAYLDTTALA
jgi:SAM-dependent methyltransferase